MPRYKTIEEYKREIHLNLGVYGMQTRQLSIIKNENKRQIYSLSLIAAISQDKLISSQIIEGAVDSTLFESFIYNTLRSIRTDKDLCKKKVVLLMDNAAIHKFSEVLETARRFKVNVLYNAEYSPWLNPIEMLFSHIKRNLKHQSTDRK